MYMTLQCMGTMHCFLSNTPFRLYKHWVNECGIATPLIVHWPEYIEDGGALCHHLAQLPDIMATCIEIAGVEYPEAYNGRQIKPLEGYSMIPIFEGKMHKREVLYWEHEGNKAVRKGDWKLVCKYPGDWELYNMVEDRTETVNLASKHPEIVKEFVRLYEIWAQRCNVIPWDELIKIRLVHKKY